MDLSEDKAKHILDFLTKKFGYDEFSLYDKKNDKNNKNRICVIKKDGYYVVRFIRAWMLSNSWHDFEPASSYAECLKMLLAAAEKGYSITTYYDKDDFIKPFTTLEELLIAYDLETGYTTT